MSYPWSQDDEQRHDVLDEFALATAREELEDMGLDEDSIDAALEAMQEA